MSACEPNIQFIDTILTFSPRINDESIKKLFLAFAKTNMPVYGYIASSPHIKVGYKQAFVPVYMISASYVKCGTEKTLFEYIANVVNENVNIVHHVNNMNDYLVNLTEWKNLNEILSKNYKHFQDDNISKQTETKPQTNQEMQFVYTLQQMQSVQPTPQIPPQSCIKYDPAKLYIKKSNVTVVQDNIKCVIPEGYREMIKLYGETRDSGSRSAILSDTISTVVLRKNKNKSVLRYSRLNKTKLVLKIGTGQIFETEHDENFEWRVPHTEENVKCIENAFIELNKWVELHKGKFAMEQLKDKEEKEKRKLEKEYKRKEQEEKIIQLIKTENFTELK